MERISKCTGVRVSSTKTGFSAVHAIYCTALIMRRARGHLEANRRCAAQNCAEKRKENPSLAVDLGTLVSNGACK